MRLTIEITLGLLAFCGTGAFVLLYMAVDSHERQRRVGRQGGEKRPAVGALNP